MTCTNRKDQDLGLVELLDSNIVACIVMLAHTY